MNDHPVGVVDVECVGVVAKRFPILQLITGSIVANGVLYQKVVDIVDTVEILFGALVTCYPASSMAFWVIPEKWKTRFSMGAGVGLTRCVLNVNAVEHRIIQVVRFEKLWLRHTATATKRVPPKMSLSV